MCLAAGPRPVNETGSPCDNAGGMTATRRIGAEDSSTRAALLDAAQQLMLDEGYAAVTSRRVAAQAGLKPQLVHYYFRTMDDLFLVAVPFMVVALVVALTLGEKPLAGRAPEPAPSAVEEQPLPAVAQ